MRRDSALFITAVLIALALEISDHPGWGAVVWVALICWALFGDFGLKIKDEDNIDG